MALRINEKTKVDYITPAIEEIDSLFEDIAEMKNEIQSQTGEKGEKVLKLLELIDYTVHLTERLNSIKQMLLDSRK